MSDLRTDPGLLKRLVEAAKVEMTGEELRRQRASFVYGNLPNDSTLSRGEVEEVLGRLEGKAA